MDLIADILPNALRRGGFGRKIREAEILDYFNLEFDNFLPGDVRSSVQVVKIDGSVATIASLSGFALRELKRLEVVILANINKKITGKKILRIRYLA
ncbi:MAG: hypothetical protein WCG01_01745 [bacterium]